LKQEGKIPSQKERLASSAEFREKVWTSLNNGGWDTVSGRSFSGQDVRILWISVVLTGGMFLKRARVGWI